MNECICSVQIIALRLTEKTELNEISWTKTTTQGEEVYRVCLENGGVNFWFIVRKKKTHILLIFSNNCGGSLDYKDCEGQMAIINLFGVITAGKKKHPQHNRDSALITELLRVLS